MREPTHCVQATPDYTPLFVVAQVSGRRDRGKGSASLDVAGLSTVRAHRVERMAAGERRFQFRTGWAAAIAHFRSLGRIRL
jgi:hypothetical protein